MWIKMDKVTFIRIKGCLSFTRYGQYPYLHKFQHLDSLFPPHIDTRQWVLSCSSRVLLCDPIKQQRVYNSKNKSYTFFIFALIFKTID